MLTAPYNPPTYFAPAYFYSWSDSGATSTSPPASTGQTPYDAPTYFPPSYFYASISSGSTSTPPPSSGLTPYNAPTYFAPSYFYGGGSLTVTPPAATQPPGHDGASYGAILSLLESTGVFEDVIFGAAIQRDRAGSDRYPMVVVTPKGWEEADDYDPTSIVRRVTFAMTIVVRSEDGSPQFDQLDELSSSVLGVVDRSDLDGTCLPALTRIRAGRYETSNRYPEQSVELEGEFTTLYSPIGNSFTTY